VHKNGGTFVQKLLALPSPNTNQTHRVKGIQWEKRRPGIFARSAPTSESAGQDRRGVVEEGAIR